MHIWLGHWQLKCFQVALYSSSIHALCLYFYLLATTLLYHIKYLIGEGVQTKFYCFFFIIIVLLLAIWIKQAYITVLFRAWDKLSQTWEICPKLTNQLAEKAVYRVEFPPLKKWDISVWSRTYIHRLAQMPRVQAPSCICICMAHIINRAKKWLQLFPKWAI